MTKIVVLPNENLCPEGAVLEAEPGESVCRALLRNDIDIEHACEMSCACTTCHCIVREGFDSLNEADELEEGIFLKDHTFHLLPTLMGLIHRLNLRGVAVAAVLTA